MFARSLLLGVCVVGAQPRPVAAQSPEPVTVDTAALQRLLVAEDARGTLRDGIAPLLEALGGGDTLLRRLLTDSVPAVRGEAANAIAQSLRRSKRNEPAPDSTRLGVGEAARVLT